MEKQETEFGLRNRKWKSETESRKKTVPSSYIASFPVHCSCGTHAYIYRSLVHIVLLVLFCMQLRNKLRGTLGR